MILLSDRGIAKYTILLTELIFYLVYILEPR